MFGMGFKRSVWIFFRCHASLLMPNFLPNSRRKWIPSFSVVSDWRNNYSLGVWSGGSRWNTPAHPEHVSLEGRKGPGAISFTVRKHSRFNMVSIHFLVMLRLVSPRGSNWQLHSSTILFFVGPHDSLIYLTPNAQVTSSLINMFLWKELKKKKIIHRDGRADIWNLRESTFYRQVFKRFLKA